MKARLKTAVVLAAAWFTSLFVSHKVLPVWRTEGRYTKFRGFRRGVPVIFMVPRIAGAAFELLEATLDAVAAAAGTTVPAILGEVPVNESQANFSLQRVEVTAPALVTGNSTNSATINVRQLRAGAPVTTNGQTGGVLATLALVTGVNLAADTPAVLAVTGTPVLLAGDVLDVQVVQIGTGLAIPAGTSVKAEIS